jgi:tetraacyldisaccharide 4'-kinase
MVWGNPQSKTERLMKGVLSPLGAFYGLGNLLHRLAYSSGLARKHKMPVPVISVGNITVGGTGKTPVVISIAQYFIQRGIKTAIISRGYKRPSNQGVVVVGNGRSNFQDVSVSGDEPMLIAQSVPEAVVLSSPDRVSACKKAISEFDCKLIILDDGFQHYRLERDIDIVLIDYNDDLQNDSLLPAGRLREQLSALKRASHVVITKVPEVPDQKKIRDLRFLIVECAPASDIRICRIIPKQWRNVSGGNETLPLNALRGRATLAFSGIARPKSFNNTLRDLGLTVIAQRFFPDHHWYQAGDLANLRSMLKESDADCFVTTAKDAVKLQHLDLDIPVYALDLETVWPEGMPKMEIDSNRTNSASESGTKSNSVK